MYIRIVRLLAVLPIVLLGHNLQAHSQPQNVSYIDIRAELPKTEQPRFPDSTSNYQKTVVQPCEAQAGHIQGFSCVLPPPPPPPAPKPSNDTPIAPKPLTSAVNSSGGSLGEWLLKLRMCESGGNYAENKGNGFYGAYQFTISTWDSLNTGYSRADLAPSGVQDQAIITNTNRSSGGLASQNPGCYRSQGLSAYPPSS